MLSGPFWCTTRLCIESYTLTPVHEQYLAYATITLQHFADDLFTFSRVRNAGD